MTRKLSKLTKKTAPNGVVAMSSDAGMNPAGSIQLDDNGQPHRTFKKDLIRVGEFIKSSTGQRISVDKAQLEHWAKTAQQFIANGNSVPLTNGHDKTGDPDKNRGWMKDAFVEGDALYGVFDVIGDDGLKAASRSFVSIYAEPEYTDGEGNRYQYPIRHVAMTTDPVITRQGKFVPIAASQDEPEPREADYLTLATETPAMDLKALADKLGLTDLTEENAIDKIGEAFDAAKKPAEDQAAELSQAQARIVELEAQAKPIELSNTERVLASRNLDSDLKALVDGGHVVPAVVEKIKPLLSTPVMLSVADGKDAPNYAPIVEALKLNDPVKLGEQTARQTLSLSHEVQDGGDDDLDKVEEQARKYAERTQRKAS